VLGEGGKWEIVWEWVGLDRRAGFFSSGVSRLSTASRELEMGFGVDYGTRGLLHALCEYRTQVGGSWRSGLYSGLMDGPMMDRLTSPHLASHLPLQEEMG
jgi:hypothetical protein